MRYIQGKYRPVGFYREENQFMELGSEEDSNQIAARKVDDRVNFKLIRSWLMFCQEHHQSHCHAGVDGIQDIPGFTAIDCASRGIVPWAEIPAESNRDYTALSYLWGTDTSTATQDGMIPSPSPKVIEDAVTATLGLGFKYLWVDRYCIPQHDPELKSAQIKGMDDVYGLSAVTIVAAAGDGPAYRLPGVSSTPRLPQKSVRIGSRTLIAIKNDTSYDIRDSKWNTRAWTLQEGVLSTRRFCFEDSQVYFQCNLMHRLESISIPDGSPKIANPATDINSTYLHGGGGDTIFPIGGISKGEDVDRMFEEYITRQISDPSDGLHAFEGVLRKATVMKKPFYNVWGVLIGTFDDADLTASLVVGLCWTLGLEALQVTVINKAWETPYPGSLRRRLFPSWSWVDWIGNFSEKCIHIEQPFEIRMSFPVTGGVLSLTQSIAMEYPDGIRMSWPDSHHDILFPSPPKEAPRILRIRGYTCDAVLWKLPQAGSPDPKGIPSSTINSSSLKQLSDFWFEDGWVWSDRDRSHCHLLLTWPTGIAFNFYDLSNEHLCLYVDWLETDKGPSSPTPLQDEYSFRVILLGRREDRLILWYSLLLTMRVKGIPMHMSGSTSSHVH